MILMNFMNFLTVQKFKFIKFMHIHDCLSDVKYFRFAGNILSKLFFQRPLVAIPTVKITREAEFAHSIRWESSLLYHMEVSSLVFLSVEIGIFLIESEMLVFAKNVPKPKPM